MKTSEVSSPRCCFQQRVFMGTKNVDRGDNWSRFNQHEGALKHEALAISDNMKFDSVLEIEIKSTARVFAEFYHKSQCF